MNIEVFVVCDAATDSGGKLNVLGAFDSIMARKLPIVHPQCAIALRMRFEQIEAGEHKIRIGIVDQDGHSVVSPLDATINVKFAGGDQRSLTANLVMNMQRLQLKKAGEYSVDLAIDGRHEKSIPLVVRLIPEQNN